MLEPYDPNKMPVVMVHGLWSSPVTWMEMFNDLRSDPLGPRALPVLVLPLPDGPAVLAQRHADARRPGDDAAASSTPSGSTRRSIRWCSSATAWAGWSRRCRRSTAATNSGKPPATIRSPNSRPTKTSRARWPTRSSSTPARRSAASSRSARRIAAASSPTAPRAGSATS